MPNRSARWVARLRQCGGRPWTSHADRRAEGRAVNDRHTEITLLGSTEHVLGRHTCRRRPDRSLEIVSEAFGVVYVHRYGHDHADRRLAQITAAFAGHDQQENRFRRILDRSQARHLARNLRIASNRIGRRITLRDRPGLVEGIEMPDADIRLAVRHTNGTLDLIPLDELDPRPAQASTTEQEPDPDRP